MTRYATRSAVEGLVTPFQVHRDIYIDQEVYRLEMDHLFANTWVYRGPRQPGAQEGRLLHHADRRPAGHHGAPLRRRGEGSLQPLPAQGHQDRHRPHRQHRQVLPLPLPRLVVQDRRLPARDPAEEGLRRHRPRQDRRRQGHEGGRRRGKLPRLRVRAAGAGGDRVSGILQRLAHVARQHGGPLARRAAGGRRAAAALHAPLQLEDAGREPDRHLPPDGRARELGRNCGEDLGGDGHGPRRCRSPPRCRSSRPS